MSRSDHDLDAFGELVAEAQDEALEAQRDDLAATRSRLLRPMLEPPRRSRAKRWAAGGAILAAAAAVALVVRPAEPAPIEAEVDGARALTGTWVSGDEASREVAFSDGSRVEVAPESALRIGALDADGAELDLVRGSAHVQVVHRDEATRWRVRAGPFDVKVVGTEFDVAWDPAQERFALHLVEGRVIVEGPTVERRSVSTGETVTVTLPERRMEVVQLDLPSDEELEDPGVGEPEVEREVTPPAPRTPPRRLRIDWRRLARDGRYGEALAAVNWDRVLATAPAGELMLLADAARLGGEASRARTALTAIRSRFAGTPHAAHAAFRLGRLDLGAGRPAAAAAWFERALAEDPEGPYAAVAAGRRMQAYDRAGNDIAARRAARAYLQAYEGGAHTEAAHALLRDVPTAPPTPRPDRSEDGAWSPD